MPRKGTIVSKRQTSSTRNHSNRISNSDLFCQPGPQKGSITGHHRFRYQYNGAAPALLVFTTNNLLSMLVNLDTAVASGALGAQTLIFDSVRLKKVRAWSVSPDGTNTSAAVSASIDWSTANAFIGNRGTLMTYTQLGSATPLNLSNKPPRNSFADMWVDQSASSYTLFTLNVTGFSGTIAVVLDIDVDFVLLDKYTTSPVQFSLRSTQSWATATGQLLYTYADNQSGTPAWKPAGVSNVY
jgi:hypothetical protein